MVDAQLRMYNTYLYPGDDTDENVDVYRLTTAFDETKATWRTSNGTTPWLTTGGGGDYDASWKASFNGFTNDPEWENWNVTPAVKGWLAAPADNKGFLLRQRDETNQTARAMLLSSEGAEPMLRPTLEVTYLEQTAESTYYAAATPKLPRQQQLQRAGDPVEPDPGRLEPDGLGAAYDWKRADGTTDGADATYELKTPLPESIPAGGTVDVTAQLEDPAVVDGGKQAHRLRAAVGPAQQADR